MIGKDFRSSGPSPGTPVGPLGLPASYRRKGRGLDPRVVRRHVLAGIWEELAQRRRYTGDKDDLQNGPL